MQLLISLTRFKIILSSKKLQCFLTDDKFQTLAFVAQLSTIFYVNFMTRIKFDEFLPCCPMEIAQISGKECRFGLILGSFTQGMWTKPSAIENKE